MTRTEERLTDALGAAAGALREEALRPLAPAAGKAVSRSAARLRVLASGRGTGSRVLAAVAAAAAIALVAGLTAVLARTPAATQSGPFPDIAHDGNPPPYYVTMDLNWRILVFSSVTGHRTESTGAPRFFDGGEDDDAALSASADGRVFVAAFNLQDSLRTRLYRFSLTSSGRITDMTRVPGPRLPGLADISLAVSPDGSQVAIAGLAEARKSGLTSQGAPRLTLVNLATGTQRSWRGPAGLYERPGPDKYAYTSLSWLDVGPLQVLITRCFSGLEANQDFGCAGTGGLAGQVWTVPNAARGGPLGRGSRILTLPQQTIQQRPEPGAHAVIAMVVSNQGVSVARYAVRSGKQLLALYRGASYEPDSLLATDGSGRYLLVLESRGTRFGWLDDGRFRSLPTENTFGDYEVMAMAW
ncbi:MAG TPA: hypothetical protein VGI64_12195 [Streptosporangiaceae bacterium]|jgi:hypothetical protein